MHPNNRHIQTHNLSGFISFAEVGGGGLIEEKPCEDVRNATTTSYSGDIVNHYTYQGRKLGKKVYNSQHTLTVDEAYYDELMLSFGLPARISHADGYVTLNKAGQAESFYFYLKDHLGNVRSVILPDANNQPIVSQASDYFPFGMSFESTLPNPGIRADYNKHKYNSKEEQEMPGRWLDYRARMYDAQLGRFHTQDAYAEKYYDLSPYQYGANNPIKNVDVNGDSIWSVFDKNSNTLYVVDYDHYQKGLPVFYASPDDYEVGGIYDKDGNLAVNQVLVIEGVFTGGQSGENGISYGNDDNQLPIPNGSYEILDYNSNNPSHKNWYRVDAIDSKPRNDINDNSEHRNYDGQLRRNFRAHVGGVSWGCITFDKNNENAVKGYDVFSRILQSTSTTQVRDRMGLKNSLGINNTSVTRYGTVKVR